MNVSEIILLITAAIIGGCIVLLLNQFWKMIVQRNDSKPIKKTSTSEIKLVLSSLSLLNEQIIEQSNIILASNKTLAESVLNTRESITKGVLDIDNKIASNSADIKAIHQFISNIVDQFEIPLSDLDNSNVPIALLNKSSTTGIEKIVKILKDRQGHDTMSSEK